MTPIQEQQIIGLFIEARIKARAAKEAADALDLALFNAGTPKVDIKLVVPEPLIPKPQTEEKTDGAVQQ